MAEIIEKRADELRLQMRRQTQLEDNWVDQARKETKMRARKRIYLPKALKDTILALTIGRTIIYFGSGHHCTLHKTNVDDEHIKQCQLT